MCLSRRRSRLIYISMQKNVKSALRYFRGVSLVRCRNPMNDENVFYVYNFSRIISTGVNVQKLHFHFSGWLVSRFQFEIHAVTFDSSF